jgi:NAD kinase
MNQHDLPSLNGLELVSYRMPILRTTVVTSDRGFLHHLAFGDAWVDRAAGQAASLELEIDGQVRVRTIVGDGVLVATSAGSSAYARSMGASRLIRSILRH